MSLIYSEKEENQNKEWDVAGGFLFAAILYLIFGLTYIHAYNSLIKDPPQAPFTASVTANTPEQVQEYIDKFGPKMNITIDLSTSTYDFKKPLNLENATHRVTLEGNDRGTNFDFTDSGLFWVEMYGNSAVMPLLILRNINIDAPDKLLLIKEMNETAESKKIRQACEKNGGAYYISESPIGICYKPVLR